MWNDKPFARGQAWIDLIQLAQFRPSYFFIRKLRVDVGRGQLCRSQEELGQRWGWGRRKVAAYIASVAKEGLITVKAHDRIGVITICNYESYQVKRTTDGTTDDTTDGTTEGTYKKESKGRKGRKEYPLPPEGNFEAAWLSYPRQRRGDKEKAQFAYSRALKKATGDEIQTGIASYAASEEVAKGFAKGMAAWLNDSRWTNQYAAKKQRGPALC